MLLFRGKDFHFTISNSVAIIHYEHMFESSVIFRKKGYDWML
jgi:hypothetical protein